jgi:hypothetical protein
MSGTATTPPQEALTPGAAADAREEQEARALAARYQLDFVDVR